MAFFPMLLFYRHRILYSYNRDCLKVYTLDLYKTHMLTISLISQKGGVGGIFLLPDVLAVRRIEIDRE